MEPIKKGVGIDVPHEIFHFYPLSHKSRIFEVPRLSCPQTYVAPSIVEVSRQTIPNVFVCIAYIRSIPIILVPVTLMTLMTRAYAPYAQVFDRGLCLNHVGANLVDHKCSSTWWYAY